MTALAPQVPTDISWEAVSERVASETERTSEEWVAGRVASEVQRVTQTRSNGSPAISIDQARVTQDGLSCIVAKTNTSLKALSKEIANLKAWRNDAHNDTQRNAVIDEESVDGG